jgi:hypothetical protein
MNYTIDALKVIPQAEGETNVVYRIGWSVSGDDGFYRGSYGEMFDVTFSSKEPFVPFNQLTEDMIWSWVGDERKTAGAAEVQAQIDAKTYPMVVTKELPWQPIDNIDA